MTFGDKLEFNLSSIKILVDCISSIIYLLLVNEYIYMNKYMYIHSSFISETTTLLINSVARSILLPVQTH